MASPGARCDGCGAEYPERGGILDLTRGRAGRAGYDPHYFGTLPLVEDAHFWFVTRREVILEGLRACVDDLGQRALFDVGCGSGGLLAFLEASGLAVAGACDAYPQGLALARGRVRAPLALVDEGAPPPLAPGQRLIGLFDEMDELAHHRRRYTRRELGDKLRAAGFEVRLLSPFMALLVPLLVLLLAVGRLLPGRLARAQERRDSELRVVPGVNGLFRGLLRLERLWLRVSSLPFGSSIVALARRPPATP